ncbi:hypothetical protein F1645_05410 [Novacetimonas hansenii]|uniref:Uncharacterized protein n=1 Tax=Novacetimonas hansenii TaxID=436 RepID=A0ABQ0SH26_NOVHA|nr:hypothetical protein [Novacetimonas hansenii]RFP03673.1 hypothetical protein BGC30_01040 [Novacetimonas hansenii]WEQ59194.1 hypothetical protein LV563_01090 [Novacetimonas hansenii]CUW47267.1 hypothetical protein ATCC53582_01375 [Novacetimonas hansenii]GAN84499.1 hypothetical protein Gaha_0185_001 [Novacetimonas hansenii JCM 7643]GBQ59449.1 hypothetical protein AA0243_2047 [Novacetimonas hansenii NRIC 0243]
MDEPEIPLDNEERDFGPRVTRSAYRIEPAVRQQEPKGFKAAHFIPGQRKAKTCGMRESSVWMEKRFRNTEIATACRQLSAPTGRHVSHSAASIVLPQIRKKQS